MTTIRPQPGILVAAAIAVLLGPATGWAQQLPGSEWKPVTIYDTPVAADSGAFVQFGGEGRIAGHGGCNQFTGQFSMDGNTITIGPLAATRKACFEALMDMESKVFKALDAARSFRRNGTILSLLDDSGAEIARFQQTDAD